MNKHAIIILNTTVDVYVEKKGYVTEPQLLSLPVQVFAPPLG